MATQASRRIVHPCAGAEESLLHLGVNHKPASAATHCIGDLTSVLQELDCLAHTHVVAACGVLPMTCVPQTTPQLIPRFTQV